MIAVPGASRRLARLLDDPGSGRVGGAAAQVDASAFELDEEEHVQALQRDRFDGEEVDTSQDGHVSANEVRPAHLLTPLRSWSHTKTT